MPAGMSHRDVVLTFLHHAIETELEPGWHVAVRDSGPQVEVSIYHNSGYRCVRYINDHLVDRLSREEATFLARSLALAERHLLSLDRRVVPPLRVVTSGYSDFLSHLTAALGPTWSVRAEPPVDDFSLTVPITAAHGDFRCRRPIAIHELERNPARVAERFAREVVETNRQYRLERMVAFVGAHLAWQRVTRVEVEERFLQNS